jgi:hypothetical protein
MRCRFAAVPFTFVETPRRRPASLLRWWAILMPAITLAWVRGARSSSVLPTSGSSGRAFKFTAATNRGWTAVYDYPPVYHYADGPHQPTILGRAVR